MLRFTDRRCLTLMLSFLLGLLTLSANAQGKKWALLIGIEEYDRAEISHLDFAVKDVNAIARVLQQNLGYEASNVRTMTSAIKDANDFNRPTNDNVIATLERLAKSVGPDDTFLFYFTGHGFNKDGQNFLASVNTNPFSVSTLRRSAIPLTDLQQAMQAFKAKQILFVIDACRNDPEKGKGEGDNKLTDDFSKSLVVASRSGQAAGAGVLFACSEGERAFEDPSKGQSVFTYYLLEALSGKAGNKGPLAMASVMTYVRKQVGAWAEEHGKKQTPELLPKEADRLVLTDQIAVPVVAALVENAAIKLLDTQAALTITSDPPGADVIVDGKTIGQTPFILTRELGLDEKKTVRIGLSQDGYQSRAFDVDLTRGKTLAAPRIVLRAIAANTNPIANPGLAAAKLKKNSKDDADMVFIPAGEFTMGDKDFTTAKPHTVTLDGYYIYLTPVTVAQYLKFCDETGHSKPTAPSFNPNWSKRDHPIVDVSYNDALAYCAWAGVKLPTEAQWEKAARGTDGRQFPWGDAFDTSKLWASKSKVGDAGGTTPVGSFPSGASPFGVLDMAGNVLQWCSDWYDKDFYSSRIATERNAENQSVGDKQNHVLRGGSWFYNGPNYFRSAFRYNDDYSFVPDYRYNSFGFRCVSGLP